MFMLIPLILCSAVDSARILGVFPMPSISHQVVFRALTLELAKRGHELVVITPNAALPKDRPKDNITEIDTSKAYIQVKQFFNDSAKTILKRGVIADVDAMTSDEMTRTIMIIVEELLENKEVDELLKDKTQKFDLVIAEGFMNYHFIFAKIYEAPLIVFSSFYGYPEIYEMIGAVARHPILYPHTMRGKLQTVSFFDKIKAIHNEYRLRKMFENLERLESELVNTKFGQDALTIDELKGLPSMVFLNSFHIFDNNRPVPPNVVYLGALHLIPVKELPQDLKQYLDNSKHGVVYVSLETNVHPSLMEKDFLDAFLNAFRQIPYDILWKFDGDNLENVPDNVRIQKWFPQRDLLVHPKIVLFVTQGGLQSTDEAIDAGVPLVGIPILGDQWFNVHRYEKLGIGVELDSYTLTADDIVKGVNTVAGDNRFRQNIKKLKSIMYDTPQTPLERAVWWTEYVLRHKGAQHLKSPAANMSYAEYFMLDFVLGLLGVFIVVLIALVFIIKFVVNLFKSDKGSKLKLN
ncbi:UDP-glucosyltransferase 2 [Manduca sexta]|uniref:UDP-glucosyltransferase 2 n=1 Tax=Manduca sexta TaxID=7130 RepID=UPI00188EBF87|nr:UDP-glucosyltransferase 2 [Manduca sexta]